MTVGIGLAAFAASLMLTKRATIQVAQRFSLGAMAIFVAHAYQGLAIVAPVGSGSVKTMAVIVFTWLCSQL